jgi:GNAT superfamily N-acetyltransferase
MIIKELTAQSLEEFIRDDAFAQLPFIPISRHRAISQINNPRAEPDDILLFLAYEGEKLIGYLGVLPDYYFNNDIRYKVGWLSCFWVDPAMRGMGVSNALGMRAVEKWDGNLVATEFTPPSKKLWLKINALSVFTTLVGVRGFLRFDLQEILPRKKPLLKKATWPIKLADNLLNQLNNIRLRYKISRHEKNFAERVHTIDHEMEVFMSQYQEAGLFRRGKQDLDWILDYPWILPLAQEDGLRNKYYFTANEKRFEFQLLKIKNPDNALIAVLLISIRNLHLKTQYAFFKEEYAGDIMDALYIIMKKEGIATFTTYNQPLSWYLKKNHTPFIIKKSIVREYLAGSKVAAALPDDYIYTIQDGDGDCAFT